jgi:WD40 repeat protein
MRRQRSFSALLALSMLSVVSRADETPRLKSTWREQEARVVVFSPDGRSLVSSGGEGHHLRDPATGQIRWTLAGPGVGIEGPAFSPDGRTLYAEVSSDQFQPVGVHDLTVWDVATGRLKATFAHIHEGLGDGNYAISGDGSRLAFLDNAERRPMQVKPSKLEIDGRAFDVAFNVNPGLPRVILWDVARWEQAAEVDGGPPLAFSRDGQILVTGDRNWKTPVAKVWEARTGLLRTVLKDRSPGVGPMALSPDGRFLAAYGHEKTSLWNLGDGRRWVVESDATGSSSRGPVFSPDGRLLFPIGTPQIHPQIMQRQEYYGYDMAGMPPKRLDLGPGELAISPDGQRYAAVGGRRGAGVPQTVTFYDLPSLRETGKADVSGIDGAGFSPDGRWLAVLAWRHEVVLPGPTSRSRTEIRLLEPATGRVRHTIPSPGQTWGNYHWKFSPDGTSLAVTYLTGSNRSTPGEPDPSDRPLTVEIWEIPPPRP